jgi:hypothetical protein
MISEERDVIEAYHEVGSKKEIEIKFSFYSYSKKSRLVGIFYCIRFQTVFFCNQMDKTHNALVTSDARRTNDCFLLENNHLLLEWLFFFFTKT